MRKLISAILVLALVATLSVTAFAADNTLTGSNNSDEIDVNVTYQDGTTQPAIYSVDISWENMNFTYAAEGAMIWDPATHEYQNQTSGGWENETAEIKVTNHSNAAVNVTVSYAAAGNSGVTATVTNGSFSLPSAEGKTVNDASLANTATLTVSGTPSNKEANNLKVGTVTVKFQ